MATHDPFDPASDRYYDLGDLRPTPPSAGGARFDEFGPIVDDEEGSWSEFGSAGGGGGSGGSLDDPLLKARLARLAPRVSVEAALDDVHASTTRRRIRRRLTAVGSAAAVLLALFLLVKTWPSGGDDQLIAAGTSTTNTYRRSTTPRGSFSPEELPSTLPDFNPTGTFAPFTPGSALPAFPTPLVPTPTLPAVTTTTAQVTTTTKAVTTTTKAPEVIVAVNPQSSAVVGERVYVDIAVQNATYGTITVGSDSASCTPFGRVTAGTSADPVIGGGGGSFSGGAGVKIEDHLAANNLTRAWLLSPASVLDGGGCNGQVSFTTLAVGETKTATVAFDADGPPGELVGLTVNFTLSYREGNNATSKSVSKTAALGWNDISTRSSNMAAVYNTLNTNATVRAFLDNAGATFTFWGGFHRGVWEFRFTQQGGATKTAKIDPSTGSLLSFG